MYTNKQTEIMEKNMKWVCTECGGINVQIRTWVDPNNTKNMDDFSERESSDCWCNDCEEHYMVELVEVV